MMPILGFIKCFAKFQELGLKASNLPAIALAQARQTGSLSRLQRDYRPAFPESISKNGQNRSQKTLCELVIIYYFYLFFVSLILRGHSKFITSYLLPIS
jgi:hypothetical protein